MKKILMLLMPAMLFCLIGCSSKEKPVNDKAPAVGEATVEQQSSIPGISDDNELPVVIDFFATWCGPCREMKPTFEAAEKEYKGRVLFISIDVDENPQLADQFNISAIPTLVFTNAKGEEQNRQTGLMTADELDNGIKALLGE